MKKSGKRLKKGDSWLRKPITKEEIEDAGELGWAVLFVYLGKGRMLTVTDQGNTTIHEDTPMNKWAWDLLEELPR